MSDYSAIAKHWEWRPRMLLIGASVCARLPWSPGDPIAPVHPVTVTAVHDGRPWGKFKRIDGKGWGEGYFRDGRPDMCDPATRGCVAFDLLPKAWGIGAKITIHENGTLRLLRPGAVVDEFFGTLMDALRAAQ